MHQDTPARWRLRQAISLTKDLLLFPSDETAAATADIRLLLHASRSDLVRIRRGSTCNHHRLIAVESAMHLV